MYLCIHLCAHVHVCTCACVCIYACECMCAHVCIMYDTCVQSCRHSSKEVLQVRKQPEVVEWYRWSLDLFNSFQICRTKFENHLSLLGPILDVKLFQTFVEVI